MTETCKTCNKKFNKSHHRQKYCSKECQVKETYKKQNARRKTEEGRERHKIDLRKYRTTEKYQKALKKYRRSDKGKASLTIAALKRNPKIKKQTPPWNDPEKVKRIYKIARKIQNATGVEIHVDHIVPLSGKTFEDNKVKISGLNVWYNLIPLPKGFNLSKRNICIPAKQLKEFNYSNLALEVLPRPNDWMRFINVMSNRMIKDLNSHPGDHRFTFELIRPSN